MDGWYRVRELGFFCWFFENDDTFSSGFGIRTSDGRLECDKYGNGGTYGFEEMFCFCCANAGTVGNGGWSLTWLLLLLLAWARGDDGDEDDADGLLLLFNALSFASGVFDVYSESHMDDSTHSEHDECEHIESAKKKLKV